MLRTERILLYTVILYFTYHITHTLNFVGKTAPEYFYMSVFEQLYNYNEFTNKAFIIIDDSVYFKRILYNYRMILFTLKESFIIIDDIVYFKRIIYKYDPYNA